LTGAVFADFFGFFFSLFCELLPLPIARTSVRGSEWTLSALLRWYRLSEVPRRQSYFSFHAVVESGGTSARARFAQRR
jgi:hypothetical protein